MTEPSNERHVGSPGSGKSQAGAKSVVEEAGASVTLDPHENSLARTAWIHATGNVLYERLSEVKQTLGLGLLDFLKQADKVRCERWMEMFTAILRLRTGADRGRVLFTEQDVQQYLESGKVEASSLPQRCVFTHGRKSGSTSP